MTANTETVPATTDPGPPGGGGFAGVLEAIRGMGRGGLLVALLIAVLFFQITSSGVMLKPLNITNVFLQNGYILVMALCGALLLATGSRLAVPVSAAIELAAIALLLKGLQADRSR